MNDPDTLTRNFTGIVDRLRLATDASRTTLRIDIDEAGLNVDDPAAESAADDVTTLLGMTALKQREIETVRWMEEHRKVLIQSACEGATPAPPEALMKVYGVKAQMLGPVIRDGKMIGWISVHENRATREWMPEHVALLKSAVEDIQTVLDKLGFGSLGGR